MVHMVPAQKPSTQGQEEDNKDHKLKTSLSYTMCMRTESESEREREHTLDVQLNKYPLFWLSGILMKL